MQENKEKKFTHFCFVNIVKHNCQVCSNKLIKIEEKKKSMKKLHASVEYLDDVDEC